jgi:ATP-dependent Lon protease
MSMLTGRKVRHDIAMTGEITLRGKVLPVGGIKEKMLAARRAGIYHIILPKLNENDLEEIPEYLRHKMTFHLVEWLDEVFELTLRKSRNSRKAKTEDQRPKNKDQKNA